ncbi:hypothetical protein ACH9EU_03940 [Kocuria sp. M1R5S2]|uniref:hypothetical protein n=1 Tax=Kocuria rhizosphaerae TaxID=3376285 RepID=UPI0037B11DA6
MRYYLALVSAVQLGLGLAGLRKALRERTAYDVGFLRGSREHLGRDAVLMGTNLSAPGIMLVLQGVCTARLLARPDPRAARTLGVLGLLMAAGYAAERSVRQAWRGGDRRTARLTAAATVLAVKMAWVGLRTPTRNTR